MFFSIRTAYIKCLVKTIEHVFAGTEIIMRSLTPISIPAFFLGLVLCALLAAPASAQTIIRDREIEKTLSSWFTPVIEAAELSPDVVNVILVQDNQINAFVAGGPNVFFFTGLILETENPGELIGVMAHELGHIRGGHLIRGRQAMERASYETLIGTILGVGAAIATGEGEAAGGIAAGSQSQAMRRFLSHSRVQESSADQAALKYMERAEMNPDGLVSFFRKLKAKEGVISSQNVEYIRTHPLTTNRIAALEKGAMESPYSGKDWPEEWRVEYARMKAKLLGFINPGHVEWTYSQDNTSIPAEYARAIAAYRESRFEESLDRLDALIEREPKNPYFHELKGQVLVDAGRLEESLAPYRTSITLDPGAGLIRIALAHALIETSYAQDKKDRLREAVSHLEQAVKSEKYSPRLHRLLATAYGRLGQTGMAKLHLAEEAVLKRKWTIGLGHARAARRQFEEGSREHLHALDLIEFIQNNKKG